jgi:hypothetical protein
VPKILQAIVFVGFLPTFRPEISEALQLFPRNLRPSARVGWMQSNMGGERPRSVGTESLTRQGERHRSWSGGQTWCSPGPVKTR